MSSLLAIISEWPLLDTLLGIGTMAEVAEEDRQLASGQFFGRFRVESISLRLTLLWLPPLVLSLLLLCWLQWVILRAALLIRHLTKKQKEREGVLLLFTKFFNVQFFSLSLRVLLELVKQEAIALTGRNIVFLMFLPKCIGWPYQPAVLIHYQQNCVQFAFCTKQFSPFLPFYGRLLIKAKTFL